MTRTDELPPFETRLLADLTEVVDERRRNAEVARPARRRTPRTMTAPRLAAMTAAAGVVAISLVVAPGLSRETGTGAFAVRELENGVLEVGFDTDFQDGEALAAELREYGVSVEIVPVPASPSAVGRVYGMEGPEHGTTEAGFGWGPDGSGVAFTIDPTVFRGDVVLHLAVEPRPGQPFGLAEEVFEPGEVLGGLHCHLGEPVLAADLVPYLEELGLDARWEIIGPSPDGDPSSALSQHVDAVPDGRVMWGYAVDATTVRFEVELPSAPLDPVHWQPRLSDLPCTADQADAWG